MAGWRRNSATTRRGSWGASAFNPLRHIDRFGTIILPALLLLAAFAVFFGYAKPVPVNFRRLQPPRLGMFMVALAGPGTNLLLALASALLAASRRARDAGAGAVAVPESLSSLDDHNCVLATVQHDSYPAAGWRAGGRSLLTGGRKRAFGKLERYGVLIVLLSLIVPLLFGYNRLQRIIGQADFLAAWSIIVDVTGNGE